MAVKSLLPAELDKYLTHLLRLDASARSFRFAGTVTDESIREYVSKIDMNSGAIKVIYDDDLNVIAAAHVQAFGDGKIAEIAISVDGQHRGHGHGREVFKRAVQWSKNRSIQKVYSICLRENTAMMHIARAEGMSVITDGGESEAHLDTNSSNMVEFVDEILQEQMGWIDYATKHQAHAWKNMFKVS